MIAAVVDAAVHAIAAGVLFGLVLAAIVALVVRLVALDATVRHLLWTVALCATAAIPLGTFAVSALRANESAAPSASASNAARAWTGTTRQRQTFSAATGEHRRTRVADAGPASRPLTPLRVAALWQPQLAQEAALALAVLWLGGAAIGLAGLALSLRRVQGLKRRSSPLDAELAAELPWLTENGAREREIYLRLSYEIETPVAIGFRRPVILIPTELATLGGLAAIEGLVLHEHAHLARRDDWTNLVQRMIERTFWFNPLVWIIGRRIALEREIAADDAVVEALGEPQVYAKSLWQLAREMRMPEHAVVAPGAMFTRKQISIRIEALLERRPVRGVWRRIAAATVAFTAVVCTVAAAATAPGITSPIAPAAAGGALAAAQPLAHPAAAPSHPALGRSLRVAVPSRIVVPSFTVVVPPLRAALAQPRVPVAAAAPRLSPPLPRSALIADCTDCKPALTHSRASQSHDLSPGSDYQGADLRNVDWRGRILRGIDLSGADLRDARLDGARFEGVNLSGARLDNASLTNAALVGSDIEGATLRGANTRGLRMSGVSFSGLDLRGLDVRALLDGCSGCDLTGADLRAADLHGVHLTAANLQGADLHGANLRGSTFRHSDLEGANFSRADLRDTTFANCTLAGADFEHADTSTTHFDGSNLDGTNLKGAQ